MHCSHVKFGTGPFRPRLVPFESDGWPLLGTVVVQIYVLFILLAHGRRLEAANADCETLSGSRPAAFANSAGKSSI
jgi:hypothetical protein